MSEFWTQVPSTDRSVAMVAFGNYMVVSCNGMNQQELAIAIRSFVTAFGLDRGSETPCGVPVSVSEAFALDALAPGPLRQQDLARTLDLTKSTISRLVDDMVARRYVKRRPDPADGRAVSVELLALGRKRAEQLQRAREAKYSALFTAIAPEDRQLVSNALRILTAAASPEGNRIAR